MTKQEDCEKKFPIYHPECDIMSSKSHSSNNCKITENTNNMVKSVGINKMSSCAHSKERHKMLPHSEEAHTKCHSQHSEPQHKMYHSTLRNSTALVMLLTISTLTSLPAREYYLHCCCY